MAELKVVCFKWEHKGGYTLPSSIDNQYTAQHVNRLERMVAKNLSLPYEFICITDDPTGVNCRTIPLWDKCRKLGGCYNRLYVFSEDMKYLIGERFVCIDLDCVVTGPLDRLFSRKEDFIINAYRAFRKGREQYYNGGLFLMNAGARKQVWERWLEGGIDELASVRREKLLVGTDQAWISHVLGRGECMYDEDDGVYNFRHLLGDKRTLPTNACMVFFAGAIDPSTEKGIGWIDQHYHDKSYYNTVEDTIEKVNVFSRNIIQETRRVHRALGYVPDVLNPRSFNEKIMWLKFFKRERLKQVVADKVMAKDYIVNKGIGLEVIPTLQVTSDVSELDFEHPRPYIVKPNHRSGAYQVVDENYKGSWAMLRRKCQGWLDTRYGGFKYEWVYDAIKPQIMIEPLLTPSNGGLPGDYRLFMLNGKCAMIQVNYKHAVNDYARRCYMPLWKPLDITWGKRPLAAVEKRPPFLAEMKRVASELAQPFDFVRVDLMEVDGRLYFSELTFFPASGCMTFSDTEFDFELGRQLTLTC